MDDAALAALDRHAQDVLETGTATALALAVTDHERTLAVRSFGDAGDSTLFQIGSVGKSFTAILVLQLVEPTFLLLRPGTVARVVRSVGRSPARIGRGVVHLRVGFCAI